MPRSIAHDELVAAARRALEKHGMEAATLERIATEAGISRVTLHRRGITKAALVADVAALAAEQYREALWPALVSDRPAAERLELALAALCEVAEQNLELLRALGAGAARLAPDAEAVFHEPGDGALTRGDWTEPLRRVLLDGVSDGTLRHLEPDETATVLFNVVGWTYIHLRTGHRWTADRARVATVEVALRGVIAPDAT